MRPFAIWLKPPFPASPCPAPAPATHRSPVLIASGTRLTTDGPVPMLPQEALLPANPPGTFGPALNPHLVHGSLLTTALTYHTSPGGALIFPNHSKLLEAGIMVFLCQALVSVLPLPCTTVTNTYLWMTGTNLTLLVSSRPPHHQSSSDPTNLTTLIQCPPAWTVRASWGLSDPSCTPVGPSVPGHFWPRHPAA